MDQSNKLSRKTFEIGQRSYIALGRKNGILAELKEEKQPEQWPVMLLCAKCWTVASFCGMHRYRY